MKDFEKYRKRYTVLLSGDGGGRHSEYVRDRLDASARRSADRLGADVNEALVSKEPDMINTAFGLIRELASAYKRKRSVFFGDAGIRNAIADALEKLSSVYNTGIEQYGNWWYWEIGIPLSLNTVFCLMYDELDKLLMKSYMAAERHFNDDIKLTGANRVWEVIIVAVRGLLTEDEAMIRSAADGIENIMDYTDSGDGFYPDGSFIQHGSFPYNGGYGRSLLYELAAFIYIFRSDGFGDIGIIYDRIKKAYMPFMAYGNCMDMVRGREVSRYYEQCDFAGARILGAALVLLSVGEDEELKRLIAGQLTEDFFEYSTAYESELADALLSEGIRYEEKPVFAAFNSMDRAVKKGRGFIAGLAMHSERIANFESINNENGHAYHTADGMLYIYKENEQISNRFWPTIDLQRLPGTTVLRNTAVRENSVSQQSFVGSCGIGENGVCAMELNPVGYKLRASKAWFFFENEIVCLGSGISGRDGITVETVVENRRVSENSRFTVCGSESEDGYDIKGAYLDGDHDMAYIFPEVQHVKVLRDVRSGEWDNIKKDGMEHSGMYVTMWIDHGKNPQDASYEYIILPKCSEDGYKEYTAKNDIRIIENSPWIQCVRKNGVTGIVFLKDKTRSMEGVLCDRRCIIMLEENEALTLAVAEPTQKQKSICIELEYSAEAVCEPDPAIRVRQLKPYISLEVNTDGLKGRVTRIKFNNYKRNDSDV